MATSELQQSASRAELLSALEHRLRTPITSIRSFSEILVRYDGVDPEKQRQFLRIILAEAERLSAEVEDLLEDAWGPPPITAPEEAGLLSPAEGGSTSENEVRELTQEERGGTAMSTKTHVLPTGEVTPPKRATTKGEAQRVPGQAWVVVFAGIIVNLCLGCLYAWSVWVKALTNPELMKANGWASFTAEQASNPASLCILVFALLMIPGGRLQDRFGPKIAASLGGLAIGAGLIVAGIMKSYAGVLLGFGVLGGIGMGLGYAAPTPAALKWFGPHRRGLIAGMVVGGYGLAAFYVAPVATYLIEHYGISASFYVLGIGYLAVILVASQFLAWPQAGYVPPGPPVATVQKNGAQLTQNNWTAKEMLRSWQYYALVVIFAINTQAGLLLIGHAAKMIGSIMAAGYLLVAWGGICNSSGRIGTGIISDRLGRKNTLILNLIVGAAIMFTLPYLFALKNIPLLFLAAGIGYWCYGAGLTLFPSFTADFYGAKNLGFNYGLVFIGWGLGSFMPKLAGRIYDIYHSYDFAFYTAGGLLLVGLFLATMLGHRPKHAVEAEPSVEVTPAPSAPK